MHKLVIAHFNQWVGTMPIGSQFTTWDIIDRFKATMPKMTPARASLGRLVMQNKNVTVVGHERGAVVYEVVA